MKNKPNGCIVAALLLTICANINYLNAMQPPPKEQSLEGRLLNAAKYGDGEEVKRLVAAGATVDCSDRYGTTPLHYAANHPNIVKELVAAKKESVHATNYVKCTPLHRAAACGNAESVTLLLEAGAQPDAKDDYDQTPRTLGKKYPKVIALLRNRGKL